MDSEIDGRAATLGAVGDAKLSVTSTGHGQMCWMQHKMAAWCGMWSTARVGFSPIKSGAGPVALPVPRPRWWEPVSSCPVSGGRRSGLE